MKVAKYNKINSYIFTILAASCAILSHDVARFSTTHVSNFSFLNTKLPIYMANKLIQPTNVILWLADIPILFFTIIFGIFIYTKHKINVANIKWYLNNKKYFLCMLPLILSSNYKGLLDGKFTGIEIASYSIFTPFLVLLFACIFLKEHITKNQLFWFLVGGFIFIYSKSLSFNSISLLLLFYPILNAAGDTFVRLVAKKRGIDGIIIENLCYVAIGIFMLKYTNTFNLYLLTYWQVWLCGLLSFGHHIFIIKAHQKSNNILPILIISFCKIFLNFISGYILFNATMSYVAFILALLIVICAILMEKNYNIFRIKGNYPHVYKRIDN